MGDDILDRLQTALDDLGKTTYSDGTGCHCDPDVGAVPCDLCDAKELMRDVRKEIVRLRRFEGAYQRTKGKLRNIMDVLLAQQDKEVTGARKEDER